MHPLHPLPKFLSSPRNPRPLTGMLAWSGRTLYDPENLGVARRRQSGRDYYYYFFNIFNRKPPLFW